MIEANQSLLPKHFDGSALKALCVGFESESLDELERLLGTLDVRIARREEVTLRKISPATYIGGGKVDEIAASMEIEPVDAIVVDADLSPNQLRNLEKKIQKPVLDRAAVILEIFLKNARTREAKTQVELARVQYLLPRLAHYWTHFERQRGGGGGGGGASRGMGEKQLEVDRRLLKKRVQILTRELAEIQKDRQVRREGRKEVLKVALVGYTNAGKSTLLNRMTQSHVLEEDKLFSTLDSCVRALDPHSHPPVVAIDTVGFISRIPTHLVASFRSTLEEAREADLLLHVVDGSSPGARDQIETTLEVLRDLGLESKPRLMVVNKIDRVKDPTTLNWVRIAAPGAIRISALNPGDVERLRDSILEYFRKGLDVLELLIPYGESKVEAQIHSHGSVEVKRYMEKGVFLKVRMEKEWADRLELSRYALSGGVA